MRIAFASLLVVAAVGSAAAPASAAPAGAVAGPVVEGFVRIEPGTFVMGSPPDEQRRQADEGPQHEVRLTRAFLLQATEVTQAQWKAVMGTDPSKFRKCGERCPAEYMTWFDAVRYANAVSAKEGLEPCYAIEGTEVRWPKGLACEGYRLPTEAEWEYAARAGTTGPRYGEVNAVAWWEDNADETTQPVARKQPNAWGLFDVLGNVWEWCWDWSGPYDAAPATDPTGPATGRYRVIRGGAWAYGKEFARAAARNHNKPEDGYMFIGLRLARTIPGPIPATPPGPTPGPMPGTTP